jgi:DNA-binding XRE family transcriptional regulator
MSDTPSPLGPNLHRHRSKSGKTQQEAATAADVTIRTVQRWEAGTRVPEWKHLLRLARLYDTTVPDLFATRSPDTYDRRAS